MDTAILNWIHTNLASPFLDAVMPAITLLGELGGVWIVLGIILLFSKKYRVYGIGILIAVILAGFFANAVIKPLFDRPRPFEADPSIQLLIPAPLTSSFPSGHTASSFAAMVVIFFMPIKIPWKVVAALVAGLIAFSRMYLMVHYPSDVLVGAILGVACGFAAVLIVKSILKRKRNKKQADLSPEDGGLASNEQDR